MFQAKKYCIYVQSTKAVRETAKISGVVKSTICYFSFKKQKYTAPAQPERTQKNTKVDDHRMYADVDCMYGARVATAY